MNNKNNKALVSATVMSLVMTSTLIGLTGQAKAEEALMKLGGANRSETAIQVSKELLKDKEWQTSKKAILAPGKDDNLIDALTAAPLSYKEKAPIYLNMEKDNIDKEIMEALKNNNIDTVYIVTGQGVISEKAEKELNDAEIKVVRLAGNNRMATAEAIMKEVGNFDEAIIVGYNGIPDAVSCSAIAAKKGMPIIIANADGSVSTKLDGKKVYALGGEQLVNEETIKLLNAERVFGKDRYETNAKIIEIFKDSLNFEKVYLGNGQDEHLIDSLVGAPLAAKTNSPIILGNNNLNNKQIKALEEKVNNKTQVIVLGESVVADDVVKEVKDLADNNDNTDNDDKVDSKDDEIKNQKEIEAALQKIVDSELDEEPTINNVKKEVEKLIDNKDINIYVTKTKEGKFNVTLVKGEIKDSKIINVSKKEDKDLDLTPGGDNTGNTGSDLTPGGSTGTVDQPGEDDETPTYGEGDVGSVEKPGKDDDKIEEPKDDTAEEYKKAIEDVIRDEYNKELEIIKNQEKEITDYYEKKIKEAEQKEKAEKEIKTALAKVVDFELEEEPTIENVTAKVKELIKDESVTVDVKKEEEDGKFNVILNKNGIEQSKEIIVEKDTTKEDQAAILDEYNKELEIIKNQEKEKVDYYEKKIKEAEEKKAKEAEEQKAKEEKAREAEILAEYNKELEIIKNQEKEIKDYYEKKIKEAEQKEKAEKAKKEIQIALANVVNFELEEEPNTINVKQGVVSLINNADIEVKVEKTEEGKFNVILNKNGIEQSKEITVEKDTTKEDQAAILDEYNKELEIIKNQEKEKADYYEKKIKEAEEKKAKEAEEQKAKEEKAREAEILAEYNKELEIIKNQEKEKADYYEKKIEEEEEKTKLEKAKKEIQIALANVVNFELEEEPNTINVKQGVVSLVNNSYIKVEIEKTEEGRFKVILSKDGVKKIKIITVTRKYEENKVIDDLEKEALKEKEQIDQKEQERLDGWEKIIKEAEEQKARESEILDEYNKELEIIKNQEKEKADYYEKKIKEEEEKTKLEKAKKEIQIALANVVNFELEEEPNTINVKQGVVSLVNNSYIKVEIEKTEEGRFKVILSKDGVKKIKIITVTRKYEENKVIDDLEKEALKEKEQIDQKEQERLDGWEKIIKEAEEQKARESEILDEYNKELEIIKNQEKEIADYYEKKIKEAEEAEEQKATQEAILAEYNKELEIIKNQEKEKADYYEKKIKEAEEAEEQKATQEAILAEYNKELEIIKNQEKEKADYYEKKIKEEEEKAKLEKAKKEIQIALANVVTFELEEEPTTINVKQGVVSLVNNSYIKVEIEKTEEGRFKVILSKDGVKKIKIITVTRKYEENKVIDDLEKEALKEEEQIDQKEQERLDGWEKIIKEAEEQKARESEILDEYNKELEIIKNQEKEKADYYEKKIKEEEEKTKLEKAKKEIQIALANVVNFELEEEPNTINVKQGVVSLVNNSYIKVEIEKTEEGRFNVTLSKDGIKQSTEITVKKTEPKGEDANKPSDTTGKDETPTDGEGNTGSEDQAGKDEGNTGSEVDPGKDNEGSTDGEDTSVSSTNEDGSKNTEKDGENEKEGEVNSSLSTEKDNNNLDL